MFIFILFSLQFQYKLKKSIDGVLGIRTWGRRMVGADKTTELWRPQKIYFYYYYSIIICLFALINVSLNKVCR